MNQIKLFIERLQANKITTGIGCILILSATILAYPKTIAWLPEDLAKEVWNIAHDAIGYAIAALAFFVKQHSTVGDVPKPPAP